MFLRAEPTSPQELVLICLRIEWFRLKSEIFHRIVGRANFPVSLLSG